jgi:hypothetical protein
MQVRSSVQVVIARWRHELSIEYKWEKDYPEEGVCQEENYVVHES